MDIDKEIFTADWEHFSSIKRRSDIKVRVSSRFIKPKWNTNSTGKSPMMLLAMSVLVLAIFDGVQGHGRLLVPPGRSTCFREGITGCMPNYNDNQLFCGGRVVSTSCSV